MAKTKTVTPQQEKFCRGIAAGLSKADAYRDAFPNSLKWKADSVHNKASAMMRKAQVAARIGELQARVAELSCLNGAAIEEEIRRLAHSDISKIIGPTGKVLLPNEIDEVTRSAIASFEIDEYGRIKYKFWNKNAALSDAAKIKGLFKADNDQKGDVVAAMLAQVAGTGFKPVK